MCGRFSQEAELSEIKLELEVEQLELLREFRPLYNIAPSHGSGFEQAFVMQTGDGQRALRLGRWWMIPHFWSKHGRDAATFTARAKTWSRSFWRRAFKAALLGSPQVGGVSQRKKKQPIVRRPTRFAFPGSSRWTSPTAEGDVPGGATAHKPRRPSTITGAW